MPIANGTGDDRNVRFTIDTGFTGWLTLPEEVINELNLERQGNTPVATYWLTAVNPKQLCISLFSCQLPWSFIK